MIQHPAARLWAECGSVHGRAAVEASSALKYGVCCFLVVVLDLSLSTTPPRILAYCLDERSLNINTL
jgi:hypothetical protein